MRSRSSVVRRLSLARLLGVSDLVAMLTLSSKTGHTCSGTRLEPGEGLGPGFHATVARDVPRLDEAAEQTHS